MCGITGIYHTTATTAVSEQTLHRMNDAIQHRGPDGSGMYLEPLIGLAHRRLSIIDLEGGDQPIFNEDESMVIVFNGEIYNYKELREPLIQQGHQFKTSSDTEVIIHLFEQEGYDCLQKLNGMFAFAIWDKKEKSLFIARDRLGEKPLYYTQTRNAFVFGSELKALLQHPDVEANIDPTALDDYLAYGYVPSPKTIFSNIYKLPAAHYLTIKNDQLNVTRYWDTTISHPAVSASDEEYLEEFAALMRESVKLRLRSDVPVGAFLSGGIDSTFTVALAAEQLGSSLSTFSVGFNEQDFDESKDAQQVADQLGTQHHKLSVEQLNLSMFPDIVAQFDEPFSDPSMIPTYFLTLKASEHVKVCVSGDAGDEFFCGYARYNAETLEREVDRLPNGLRSALFTAIDKCTPESFFAKGRIRRFSNSGYQRWQQKIGSFDLQERKQLFRSEFASCIDPSVWLFKDYFQSDQDRMEEQGMNADQHTYLTDDILVKTDRMSMWHGLELRVPFLDHHVVEFANRLPHHLKKQNGTQKIIIKEMLKKLNLGYVNTRPKRGFGIPIKHWLKNQYYDYTKELLLSSDSQLSRYLNSSYVQQLIEINRNSRRDVSKRIWTLLCLEQWLRSVPTATHSNAD